LQRQTKAQKNNPQVWRRPDKKNKALIVLRASIEVQDVDAEDIMGVWRDIDYRFSWDDRCVKNTCHSLLGEHPDTQNEIGYYEGPFYCFSSVSLLFLFCFSSVSLLFPFFLLPLGAAPAPLSNRDFVLQSGWRYEFKGEKVWLSMNKSIDHEAFPEVKGIVRGISFMTGTQVLFFPFSFFFFLFFFFQIRQLPSGALQVTYVSNGDVGGWIPKPVTNWVVTKAAPGMMKQLIESAKGYKTWQNSDDKQVKKAEKIGK
jgi:hypothetical protein